MYDTRRNDYQCWSLHRPDLLGTGMIASSSTFRCMLYGMVQKH